MSRTHELLKLPVRSAARILGLWRINDVEVAMSRLQLQANHVGHTQLYKALRALHDVLHAFAPQLNGSLSKKGVRGLTEQVRTAHKAVQAAAMFEFLDRLPLDVDERDSTEHYVNLAKSECETAARRARKMQNRFAELSSHWRKSLRSYKVRVDPDQLPNVESFETVALAVLGEAGAKLRKMLEQIEHVEDQKSIAKVANAAGALLTLVDTVRSRSIAFADSARGLEQLDNLLNDIGTANAARKFVGSNDDAARVIELVDQARANLFIDLQRMWLLDNNKWFFQRLYKAREATFRPAIARSGYLRDPARAPNPLPVPSAV